MCYAGAMPSAALYVRLSEDREGQTSTARQEEEAARFCASHGLEVAATFVDEGLSAYRRGVRRPAYEEALLGLQEGRWDVLVVWKLDRFSRQGMGAVGAVLDSLEGTGRYLLSVVDGVDTRTAQGRLMVAILAEMARSESLNTSTRVRSAFALARRTGRWVYGRPPWGYRLAEGRLEHDPATYAAARLVVERLLAGESFRATARWMNAEGITTTAGGPWTSSTLGAWATSPVLAGLLPAGRRTRVAHRDPTSGDTVSVGQGIATEAESATLRAMAEKRAASSEFGRHGSHRGRRLLGRLVRCAVCGSAMAMRGDTYTCTNYAQGGGCSGANVVALALERYVQDAALRRLRALDPEDLEPIATAWGGTVTELSAGATFLSEEALKEAQARLEALEADHYERGAFKGREEAFRKLQERLLAEVERRTAEVASRPRVDALGLLGGLMDPEAATDAWEAAGLETKRAVLAAMLDRVAVNRAPRQGAPFDGPRRVALVWKEI